MILLMLAAVMFAGAQAMDWKMNQPEYQQQIVSLSKGKKALRVTACIMLVIWGASLVLR